MAKNSNKKMKDKAHGTSNLGLLLPFKWRVPQKRSRKASSASLVNEMQPMIHPLQQARRTIMSSNSSAPLSRSSCLLSSQSIQHYLNKIQSKRVREGAH